MRYYGGGSGEDNFIMPMDIAGMRDNMNYDSFGGAGDETTSSINTDDFIYNNYKDINDKSHDILTATEMSRNNNANIDEIIELLKAIKQNTFNTVEAVKEA